MTRSRHFVAASAASVLFLSSAADPIRAESRLAQRADATIEVLVDGNGPLVLMIPSLGRGAEDFDDLSRAVIAAGYRVARLQPRGVSRSSGAMEKLTMRDLADDAAAGIAAAGGGPVVVIGHAFGQRVARMVAAAHPDLVRAVVMLAAGGKAPPLPAASAALQSYLR
jgi:pimeloyl-ACP methyl ester carboxylesterase